jgi:hypothetical protein
VIYPLTYTAVYAIIIVSGGRCKIKAPDRKGKKMETKYQPLKNPTAYRLEVIIRTCESVEGLGMIRGIIQTLLVCNKITVEDRDYLEILACDIIKAKRENK